CAPRRVRAIDEQRNRRSHRLIGGERNELVRLGRSLDQHDIGCDACERALETSSGAGTVMANAENMHSAHDFRAVMTAKDAKETVSTSIPSGSPSRPSRPSRLVTPF